MSDLGYNVFGVVAGVIGILTVIPSMLAWWYLGRFPSSKLKIVDGIVKEVDLMFQDCVREGVLHHEDLLRLFHARLWTIKTHMDDLRTKVYVIRTWKDELKEWISGLSNEMHLVYEDAADVRTMLVKTSSRERRKLAVSGHSSRFCEANLPATRVLDASLQNAEQSDATIPRSLLTSIDVAQGGIKRGPPLSLTSDSAQGIGSLRSCHLCHIPQNPPKRLPSDVDLEKMMLATLCSPSSGARVATTEWRRRTIQHDLLLRFGRHLCCSAPATSCTRTTTSRTVLALRARIKKMSQLLKRTCGLRLKVVVDTDKAVLPYSASAGPSAADDGEWEDV